MKTAEPRPYYPGTPRIRGSARGYLPTAVLTPYVVRNPREQVEEAFALLLERALARTVDEDVARKARVKKLHQARLTRAAYTRTMHPHYAPRANPPGSRALARTAALNARALAEVARVALERQRRDDRRTARAVAEASS